MSPNFWNLSKHNIIFGKVPTLHMRLLISQRWVRLFFSFLDKGIRQAAKNYLKTVLKNPMNLFRKMHYQTVLMIQLVDFLQDGRQNMCDNCRDITVWNNTLV